jgi:hypothetical protein
MPEAREHLNVISAGPCITFVALNDLLYSSLRPFQCGGTIFLLSWGAR